MQLETTLELTERKGKMMSNLISHALTEFRAAKWVDENGKFYDEMQEAICNHVIELLKVFSEEGHSGSSAPYAVDLFSNLAMYKPIVPLTGEDWEWVEVGDGVFQNKRCSGVFKQKDRFNGQPYYLDGKVFWEWYRREEDNEVYKSHYTNSQSFVPITFPYTPTTEYVFVPTDEFPNQVVEIG